MGSPVRAAGEKSVSVLHGGLSVVASAAHGPLGPWILGAHTHWTPSQWVVYITITCLLI